MGPGKILKGVPLDVENRVFFRNTKQPILTKNTLGRCFNVFVQLACWDMKVHVEMSPTTSPGADGQVVELFWGSF